MAEEMSEHDTFVSVDMYAPTQSSIGAAIADAEADSEADSDGNDSQRGPNDTVSLSEYIGEGGDEDLLHDDILDHVNNNNNSSRHSINSHIDTTDTNTTTTNNTIPNNNFHCYNPDHDITNDSNRTRSLNPSPQYSRTMRQNTNRHDSAFMWTLTNEPSPEAFRQNDQADYVAPPADDTLSLGDGDEGDVCGSFDATTLSGEHVMPSSEHQDDDDEAHTHTQSVTQQTPRRSSDVVPTTPYSGHRDNMSLQFTPGSNKRRDSVASEPSPQVPCSSERPPLPPSRSVNSVANSSSLPTRHSPMSRSGTPATPAVQPSETNSLPSGSPNQFTPMSENSLMVYDPKFNEASHGLSSSSLPNPFPASENETDWPKDIVIISKIGPVDANDISAFEELATSSEQSKVRLVKRLVETIVFQCDQLDHFKDSEVNLARSLMNDQLRRYSDTAHERSFAMDGLIEEVDDQRDQISNLEEQNAMLKRKLLESENKVKQVENYYSNIVGDFNLSHGNVISALESVHDDVERFRRENLEQSERKSSQVEDYARRLLEMEDIVADARKRMKKMEAENEELRATLDGEVIETSNKDDDDDVLDSPVRSTRRSTSPDKSRDEEQAEYMRTIEEQHIEIDNLRLLQSKAEEDQKKLQDAFLNLNVELEEARSKTKTLQKQRDNAEAKNRELLANASTEKKNYLQLSNEMSKNIVQVVNELDEREQEMRSFRSMIEDRDSVIRNLENSNQDLEDQLQAFTEAALDRSRSRNNTAEGSSSHPLVETFIKSLQKELAKAQTLLQERTNEVDRVKKAMQDQDESIIRLQKECSRLQAAAAVRRRSASVGSPTGSNASSSAEEERFLRRLSEKLGCSPKNNHELVEQLAKRVESLMVERAEVHDQNEKIRQELSSRERNLHKLRSEMQAEISTLKAEAVHQENLKVRAQDELKIAEERLLHVLNEGDLTRRESLGDITVSSVGTRAWMLGDEDGGDTRRGSIPTPTMAGSEDTIRWTDPIINAAVQSLNQLIGNKDDLAMRNRDLRDKLQALINALAAQDQDGTARAVIIQSKELQDELTGVVGMQQDIIEKLTNAQSVQAARADGTSDDSTLSYINPNLSRISGNGGELVPSSPGQISGRAPLGEATRFLNEQLASTRSLYSDKLRANVELCGVVEELQEEVQQYKTANSSIETALSQLQESHDSFLSRLSAMTGAERSVVALEDFIRASLHDMLTLQTELEKKEVEERVTLKRVYGLLAQKRLLAHLISFYQNKYRLNILAPSSDETSSLKRRLRVRVFAVMAMKKLMLLSDAPRDAPVEHELPEAIDISNVEASDVCIMEANIALSAVPKLEKALVEKEQEVARLESTIDSLNRSAAAQQEQAGASKNPTGEVPRSSYSYKDDVINRKNELSRRLQKLIREKEDLEDRLSQEKQSRLTAEAKAVKYMEKASVYKKRLGKIHSHAEAKESAYKSAIRYLKNKADKAVQNDVNMDDENVAPVPHSTSETDANGNLSKEPNAATRAMLQDRLAHAEAELADLDAGTARYEEVKGYAHGLRRTIHRLEKPLVFKRSQSSEANKANKV